MNFTSSKPLEHGSRVRAFKAPIVFFSDSFCSLLNVKISFKVSQCCVETAVLIMPQQFSPQKNTQVPHTQLYLYQYILK